MSLISSEKKFIKRKKMRSLLKEDEFRTLKMIRINLKSMSETRLDTLWPGTRERPCSQHRQPAPQPEDPGLS